MQHRQLITFCTKSNVEEEEGALLLLLFAHCLDQKKTSQGMHVLRVLEPDETDRLLRAVDTPPTGKSHRGESAERAPGTRRLPFDLVSRSGDEREEGE